MSPPPRDWVPPEDNRHRKEPSEATIREMQRGAAAIGREYKEGDARRHERMNALRTWQRQGRLRYSTAPDPTTDYMFDTVVVGDEYFSEPTVEFPSEELFARIGLAVNFGGTSETDPHVLGALKEL